MILFLYSIVLGKYSMNNRRLLSYVFLFSIVLPIVSFCIGYITNMENYDKPNLFGAIKPYLFLFFAFSFQSDIKLRNDIINIFAYSLLALSITIIILLTLFTLDLVPFEVLYSFGDQNVLYSIGDRSYGAFSINRVYFHSSPMLVFSLCYFLNEFFDQKRKVFLCMALVTSVSLFISGTRNNMDNYVIWQTCYC